MESANKIALDSNFLLGINECKIDVFKELKKLFGKNLVIAIPEAVENELEGLKKKNVKARKSAEIAEKLLKLHKVKTVKTIEKNADKALIELSKKNFFIGTNDKELKKKVKKLNGKLIFFRQKKYLEID